MQKWGVILFEYNFFLFSFFTVGLEKKEASILFLFCKFIFLGKTVVFRISWVSFYYLQAIVPIPNPNPDGPKFFP